MIIQMKDVAKRAGVSLSTVSFVLNKKRGTAISAQTAQRVWDAARELNYRVNVHARRLAGGQSNVIGLIISEMANPFFTDVIRGFEAAAAQRGLELLLCNTEYQLERMDAAVNKMLSEGVRGVAIMTSTFGEEQCKAFAKRRVPVVLLSVGPDSPRARRIELDFASGMFQAIDHLVSLGHSSFAVISGPIRIGSAATTRDAFISCLNQRGLKPTCVLETDYRAEGGMSAIRSLIQQGSLPGVLLCGNDLIALGALSALQEANIRVPEDVSVVGVDDIIFARLASPPLTTIRVQREELGRRGFEVLDQMRRSSKSPSDVLRIPTELVIRKSTAGPGQQIRGRKE